MIRILIVDDQEMVREALKTILEPEKQLQIVGMAQSGREGIELIEQLQPDVAIIDLTMPDKNGIETTYLITQNYPQTKVIIYTSSNGRVLNQAILVGAKGYLLKNNSTTDLVAAIEAVNRGNVYIGKGILDRVQLSSAEFQLERVKQINSRLAKEILRYWHDSDTVPASVAEKTIDELGLNQSGLNQMKNYLCHREDQESSLFDDLLSEIEGWFARIASSTNPKRRLREDSHIILSLLDEDSTSGYCYLYVLRDNFESLKRATFDGVQNIIASVCQQASPLPLLTFLKAIEKRLSNWEQFLLQECRDNLEKRKSALRSFDYILKSRDGISHKMNICKKAVILAYECRIEAELYGLLAQITAQMNEQFKAQIGILDKTNSFLIESIEQLEQGSETDLVSFAPYIEELQKRISLEKLRQDMEKRMGHSLNQWGICRVSSADLNQQLLKRLEPITQNIYLDLRREALAVSFLKYVQDANY